MIPWKIDAQESIPPIPRKTASGQYTFTRLRDLRFGLSDNCTNNVFLIDTQSPKIVLDLLDDLGELVTVETTDPELVETLMGCLQIWEPGSEWDPYASYWRDLDLQARLNLLDELFPTHEDRREWVARMNPPLTDPNPVADASTR